MKQLAVTFIFLSLIFSTIHTSSAKSPKGKQTGVTFDQALPEDISNENFPDRIESFDFPKANLLDLVKAISKLTGMNFILDPSLNNKQISIIASSPITVAEAYKAFLSALSANNYNVVKSGAFWKIQTTDKAHKDNIEVYSGDYFPSTDQLITRIIKPKHINAKELESSIKWLLSQDNKISTHESSNSIIVSDYGSVIERIMKIISEMDVPGFQEDVHTIEVEYASAEDLAVILRELLSIGRSSSPRRSNRSRRSNLTTLSPNFKSQGGAQLKISHIIPDTRTNSLIVRADTRGIERVRELVKKLDTQANLSRTGGVWVYNVLYGTAEEVYNTLMGIKPASRENTQSKSRFFVAPGSNRSNTRKQSSESPLFANVNIMADHNTNSLIISARSKYEYGRVLNVLKKIDVPRDQVFIQAIILEMIVGRGNTTDFNLAGALGGVVNNLVENDTIKEDSIFKTLGESAIAGFLSDSIGLSSLQQTQFGPGLILGLPFIKLLESLNVNAFGKESISASNPEFEDLDEDGKRDVVASVARANANNPLRQSLSTSFLPLVRLLRKSDNINILSTPQITTLDNVPAFIEVGENAPVGLSNTSTVSGISQNIDREDITLKLEITPLINPESGTVQMDIKQKFDDFSERSSLAAELNRQAVSVVKRNIETQMVLHDGETAVLGGLLSDKKVTNHNKVPLLGDIPFVGWLFKGSDVKTEKRNLLVFITPTIISGVEQREKSREILDKKLEERIEFIEEYMRGKDPHENLLGGLVPRSKTAKEKYIHSIEIEPVEENTLFEKFKTRKDSNNDEGSPDTSLQEELDRKKMDRQKLKFQESNREEYEMEEIEENELEDKSPAKDELELDELSDDELPVDELSDDEMAVDELLIETLEGETNLEEEELQDEDLLEIPDPISGPSLETEKDAESESLEETEEYQDSELEEEDSMNQENFE